MATTATIAKTSGVLLALQEVTAAPRVVISSGFQIGAGLAASIFVRISRTSAAAFTSGVIIRYEISPLVNSNGYWSPLAYYMTDTVAPEAEAISGNTASAGATIINVVSTTNLIAGNIIFIKNSGTFSASEFARISNISANNYIQLEEALVNSQPSGNLLWNKAEIPAPCYIPGDWGISQARIVVDGSNAGVNYAVEAFYTIGQAITTT